MTTVAVTSRSLPQRGSGGMRDGERSCRRGDRIPRPVRGRRASQPRAPREGRGAGPGSRPQGRALGLTVIGRPGGRVGSRERHRSSFHPGSRSRRRACCLDSGGDASEGRPVADRQPRQPGDPELGAEARRLLHLHQYPGWRSLPRPADASEVGIRADALGGGDQLSDHQSAGLLLRHDGGAGDGQARPGDGAPPDGADQSDPRGGPGGLRR